MTILLCHFEIISEWVKLLRQLENELNIGFYTMQEIGILIRVKSSCVAVASLKQSYKTWIGFYLASMLFFRLLWFLTVQPIFCADVKFIYDFKQSNLRGKTH